MIAANEEGTGGGDSPGYGKLRKQMASEYHCYIVTMVIVLGRPSSNCSVSWVLLAELWGTPRLGEAELLTPGHVSKQ